LVIAAWQQSTNAFSSRIAGDSGTGIVMSPSVTGEGEAGDADPEKPLPNQRATTTLLSGRRAHSDDVNKAMDEDDASPSGGHGVDPLRALTRLSPAIVARAGIGSLQSRDRTGGRFDTMAAPW
jgi:hypothetical protein